eukprot:TRINITY_DN10483_c0_g1_i10.p1 TRINITY_DN10483_c0_g1~~TRINITY_DN10483_c0_g1_i10.p1  ORF type:complete len:513 (+),score=116.52 TRINITY_DN10483_c0_g1_i10:174-1712(+)
MLKNFLFSDLQMVKSSFPEFDEKSAKSTSELVRLIRKTALASFNISARKNFVPALITMGYKEKCCKKSFQYYAKAAEILFSKQELISLLYTGKINEQFILTKTDPYAATSKGMNPEYALRVLDNILVVRSNVKQFVEAGINLFRLSRYADAISVFKKVLEYDKEHHVVNYYMGVMHLFGLGTEQETTEALSYFSVNYYTFSESKNALGLMYEHYGVTRWNLAAEEAYFSAAQNGSAHGNFNAFASLAKKGQMFTEPALTFLMKAATLRHPRAQYIAALLLVLEKDYCKGLSYLASSVESQVWETYFKDIYQHFIVNQEKVATMYYMVLGEMGEVVSQVNAGNLLDDHDFFWSSSYVKNLNPNWNADKYLAFKYYKMAEDQGMTGVYKRLADFYYFGLIPEKNFTTYLQYLNKALEAQSPLSITSQISFDIGVICQFNVIPGLHCDEDAELFYNSTRSLHSSGYVPGTIMLKLTEWFKGGIEFKSDWLMCAIPFLVLAVWLLATFVLIYKRQI